MLSFFVKIRVTGQNIISEFQYLHQLVECFYLMNKSQLFLLQCIFITPIHKYETELTFEMSLNAAFVVTLMEVNSLLLQKSNQQVWRD